MDDAFRVDLDDVFPKHSLSLPAMCYRSTDMRAMAIVPDHVLPGDRLLRVGRTILECLVLREGSNGVFEIIGVAFVRRGYSMNCGQDWRAIPIHPERSADGYMELCLDEHDALTFALRVTRDPTPESLSRLPDVALGSLRFSSYACSSDCQVSICATCGNSLGAREQDFARSGSAKLELEIGNL